MNKYLAQLDLSKIKIDASNGLFDINDQKLPIGAIISKIFETYIFYAAAIMLLIYLMVGGFQMMFSKGDPKAMQSAQGKITNALLGFIIVITAFLIVQLIGKVLNLQSTSFGLIFTPNVGH